MRGEIRQNKATKQWVIYSPGRAGRPNDAGRLWRNDLDRVKMELPRHDPDCPFCPGNEHMLPGIIMELPGPDESGWQTRVVPNKYPAVSPTGDTTRYNVGIYWAMQGYGRHEVIIESSCHDCRLAGMSEAEVGLIIETYHRRYTDLLKEHRNMMTLIFRNHGVRAGTSLLHPHSQIIVTGMVPTYIRWREDQAQAHFDETGRCVYCEIIDFELKYRRRLVVENETFVGFVPFAAEVPFEVWIIPRRHQACFGEVTDPEKADLSAALRHVLARLDSKLGDPDYNYIINTAARYKEGEPQLHWYLQIRPRLTTMAGFEIGSGIAINPSIPEEDADTLNEAEG